MKQSFSIGEAKTHLSRLIALVEQGECVELRRGSEPVAQITPLPPPGEARRRPGAMAGKIKLAEDFDTWPPDVAEVLGAHG